MADRSVGRQIGNLALALINATLILVAICLWLAWSALSAAERVSAQISDTAEAIVPVRAEMVALTEEIAGARADLAARRTEGGAITAELEAIEAHIAGVEEQLAHLAASVGQLEGDPDEMIAQAVDAAFASLGALVSSRVREVEPDPGG